MAYLQENYKSSKFLQISFFFNFQNFHVNKKNKVRYFYSGLDGVRLLSLLTTIRPSTLFILSSWSLTVLSNAFFSASQVSNFALNSSFSVLNYYNF